MKKAMFFAVLFAAGLLTTACSSDNDIVQEKNSLENKFDANGNAFVNIAINTPTRSGTRANEVYDDGTAAEYAVKDAVLVLFQGKQDTREHEDAATFLSASKMDNSVAQGSSNIRISDKILFTQQINKGHANLAGGTGLLAFLVVNHNGKFVVSGNSLSIDGIAFTGTFDDLKALTLDKIGDTSNGLLMTNAPMSSKPGKSSDPSSAAITYLTEIEAEDIYNSESDAYNGSRFVDIYVERAAAKINVTSSVSGKLIEDGSVTYTASGIKWTVENYNTSYFIERHISNSYFGSTNANLTSPNYRFVDSQPVESGLTLYRTYWAEDNNPKAAPDVTSSITGTQPDITSWNTLSSVQYVAENTVNEEGLIQTNTTRLVLAVPFNSGNDFYTASWAGADVIIGSADINASALAFVKTLPSYTTWKAAQTDNSYDITAATVTADATDGTAKITALTVSSGATAASDVLTEAQTMSQISYFKNGLAYYKVLIRHFDDTETPLASVVSGTDYNNIYGSSEANRIRDFLGRYSVVRNNWYNIELQGIKHIGKPTVPTIPTTPDDEIDAYLKVRINVLSWAKRTQSVIL